MTRRVWSEQECEALVRDYLSMLKAEQLGQQFNKAAHIRLLTPQLDNRTKGAIEDKHENVSAIANQLGFPGIDGYKPQGNYQKLLVEVVERLFNSDLELASILAARVQTAPSQPPATAFDERRVAPPKPIKGKLAIPASGTSRRPWLQIEATNGMLGHAGEVWVLEHERERLTRSGKANLAERIEHVSVTQGDGAGYDIRSYEIAGNDRLIEVKTTSNPKETPFFVTRNELRVSQDRGASYHLYRVFHFGTRPRFFALQGALDDTCSLEPTVFRARVR